MWYDMVWYGRVLYGMVWWCGMVWCRVLWHGASNTELSLYVVQVVYASEDACAHCLRLLCHCLSIDDLSATRALHNGLRHLLQPAGAQHQGVLQSALNPACGPLVAALLQQVALEAAGHGGRLPQGTRGASLVAMLRLLLDQFPAITRPCLPAAVGPLVPAEQQHAVCSGLLVRQSEAKLRAFLAASLCATR